MSTTTNITAEQSPSMIPPEYEAAVGQFKQYQASLYQPTRPMDSGAPVKTDKSTVPRFDETLISEAVTKDPHLNDLVKKVDDKLNAAVDIGLPEHNSFAGITSALGGGLGMIGKIGVAKAFASSTDDMSWFKTDELDSPEESTTVKIEEPEIGAPNNTTESQQEKSAISPMHAAIIEAMHDTTVANMKLAGSGQHVEVSDVMRHGLEHAIEKEVGPERDGVFIG